MNDYKIELVAGEAGLTNEVKWVHMVENEEISSFLDGQEIVFTTGIGISSDEELLSLIKHNVKNGASGMVINKGPYIKRITKEMVDYCNKSGFPLFAVPWEEKMARIMKVFSFYILEEEKKKIELSSAIKNAILSSNQEVLFLPTLEKYGFKPQGNFRVALFDVVDNSKLPQIKKDLEFLLENKNLDVAITVMEDVIFILFSNFNNQIITQLNKEIEEIIHLKYKNVHYFFSIGGEINQLQAIKKSYKQALFVQKVLKNKKFGFYEDIGAYQVLFELSYTSGVRSFVTTNLDVLSNYDLVKNTNYTEVLRLYIESNGSVMEVADKLYLHRNTINYRISRIEELMNCNLDEFNTRLNIALAFMLLDVFGNEST
ncbi:PucR family transcriptional regulator [Planococcus faecalis]|uniref:PucR family transcriptional regulator n=1 Tax=Planococcus faecalis TaxID=1598147 RepID=UPI00125D52CB|nr:PucR family transcriptional regulator [Planococcus faecalis]